MRNAHAGGTADTAPIRSPCEGIALSKKPRAKNSPLLTAFAQCNRHMRPETNAIADDDHKRMPLFATNITFSKPPPAASASVHRVHTNNTRSRNCATLFCSPLHCGVALLMIVLIDYDIVYGGQALLASRTDIFIRQQWSVAARARART